MLTGSYDDHVAGTEHSFDVVAWVVSFESHELVLQQSDTDNSSRALSFCCRLVLSPGPSPCVVCTELAALTHPWKCHTACVQTSYCHEARTA